MLTKCHTEFSLIFVQQRVIPQTEATQVVHLQSEFCGLMSDSFSRKIRLFTSTPEKESESSKLLPISEASNNTK